MLPDRVMCYCISSRREYAGETTDRWWWRGKSGKETKTDGNRSDVHFWKHGKIGTLVFEGDCIIGHEAAGVVIRCGEGVTDFRPGTNLQVTTFSKMQGLTDEQCRRSGGHRTWCAV